jgi:glycosyltransferase involved in cell wall biosynthesis
VAGVHSSHSIQHNITHWIRNKYATRHFIADADSVRDVLVREDRISPERITIIPIGVEPGRGENAGAWRRQIRAELNVDDRTVVIGNVARLVAFKGHRVLLDAVAQLAQHRSDFVVAVAGDGELFNTLHEQAQRLNIAQRVRFLGFRDDLDRLYAGFDIYCHSSLEMAEEAFPLAILRALAEGLPVVCTRVGGIAAMLEDGVSGFLKPADDPSALAEGLLACIADGKLRESMGMASRRIFDRHYHARIMAERMEQVYEKVLAA